MICTRPRTVLIIAYRDWLNNPTIEKKILASRISTKWYRINESTESNRNRLGPHTKFKENSNWVENNNERKIGAAAVVGRGIIKISLVSILKRSARIWNAPLRPIKVGPIRRCANAKSLRSVKTINKVRRTTTKAKSSANSWIKSYAFI